MKIVIDQPGNFYHGEELDYVPWEDYEEDNVKIFHEIKTPHGVLRPDFTPYEYMTEADIRNFISLCTTDIQYGSTMPTLNRIDGGAWDSERLKERKAAR